MNQPKVYIIIVNWNGWRDTIECLESVFRLNYQNYTVIVCDNDSTDYSIEHISAWANGCLNSWVKTNNPLRTLTYPPINKPIPLIEYTNQKILSDGNDQKPSIPLVFIRTGYNLGFAGGNNVGLRYILNNDNFDYVWLLNNDTVVHPDALFHLVDTIKAQTIYSMCGSTLIYYDNVNSIQAQGGAKYNKWLGTAKRLGEFNDISNPLDRNQIENDMDYIAGASMLVRKDQLVNVGLMNEDYFLYYEELDWAVRSKSMYKLAYAPESYVYHKEGMSIGSNTDYSKRSLMSEYYMFRNRIVFTLKFYPYAFPVVFLGFLVSLFLRIKRRQWENVWTIITAVCLCYADTKRYKCDINTSSAETVVSWLKK